MSGVRYANQYARHGDGFKGGCGFPIVSREYADDLAERNLKRCGYRRSALIVCRLKPLGAPKRYADEFERQAWEWCPTDANRRQAARLYLELSAIRREEGRYVAAAAFDVLARERAE